MFIIVRNSEPFPIGDHHDHRSKCDWKIQNVLNNQPKYLWIPLQVHDTCMHVCVCAWEYGYISGYGRAY
jgi:hypothetical protein